MEEVSSESYARKELDVADVTWAVCSVPTWRALLLPDGEVATWDEEREAFVTAAGDVYYFADE